MYNAIKSFHKQFEYDPQVENESKLTTHKKFVVLGMGGSHLAADLLKTWNPFLDITIHRDYGIPPLHEEELRDTLIIVSSYSGSTEEVIDGFKAAQEKNCSMAVITIGGELLTLAEKAGIPYVRMPDTGIQPRMALGYSLKALFKLMGEETALRELDDLARNLNPSAYEEDGKALACRLRGFVPLVYSSIQNQPVAYIWKIKFNETGKIPAFFNVFPELNHNEMTGFDVKESTKGLSEKFYAVILKDPSDYFKVIRRMAVLIKLYQERGIKAEIIEMKGKTRLEKVFSSLILADWAAYFLAEHYGVESEQVPMVEEFKKLVSWL